MIHILWNLLFIYGFFSPSPAPPRPDHADDPQFNEVLQQAQVAIDNEVYPERIYQGSSGSYFVKSRTGVSHSPTAIAWW